MKKILVVLLVFFTLCGCGKKLTCTYEKNYEDIQIKNKMTFNFKDKTYKQVDKMVFNDQDSAEKYFQDVSEYIEEYNLVLDGNMIISEIEDKFSGGKNKKEIKQQYESYDYKCK